MSLDTFVGVLVLLDLVFATQKDNVSGNLPPLTPYLFDVSIICWCSKCRTRISSGLGYSFTKIKFTIRKPIKHLLVWVYPEMITLTRAYQKNITLQLHFFYNHKTIHLPSQAIDFNFHLHYTCSSDLARKKLGCLQLQWSQVVLIFSVLFSCLLIWGFTSKAQTMSFITSC